MSMNFSDFKRLLGADPRSQDPETLRARQSAPEFETAALEGVEVEEAPARSGRKRGVGGLGGRRAPLGRGQPGLALGRVDSPPTSI